VGEVLDIVVERQERPSVAHLLVGRETDVLMARIKLPTLGCRSRQDEPTVMHDGDVVRATGFSSVHCGDPVARRGPAQNHDGPCASNQRPGALSSPSGHLLSTYEQMSDGPGVSCRSTTMSKLLPLSLHAPRDSMPRCAPESRSGAVLSLRRQQPRPQRMRRSFRQFQVGQEDRPSRSRSPTTRANTTRPPAEDSELLVVEASDVALCGSLVRDWIVDRPSAEERAFARKRWVACEAFHSDHDKPKPSPVLAGRSAPRRIRRTRMRYRPHSTVGSAEQARISLGGTTRLFTRLHARTPVLKSTCSTFWSRRQEQFRSRRSTDDGVFDRHSPVGVDDSFALGADLDIKAGQHARLPEALKDERDSPAR